MENVAIKEELFNPEQYPKTYQYVRQLLVRNRRCRKCGRPVLKAQVPKFQYQCVACDKDLKAYRTVAGKACTDKEINELCIVTRDTFMLDDAIWNPGNVAL